MRGMMTLSLGGYTIIFALTFLILVAILFGIFVYRQIQRLRNNSARKEINSSVALELSKKGREAIMKKIEAVHCFRKMQFPKFTDCTMISEHANSPMVHRMIAFDEILRDVDRQLEFINPDLARVPGESTYSYLKRIKLIALPELSEEFIARLAFLHEWCRFRPEMPFGEAELEETRSLLKSFLKILNKNQQLTSLKLPFTRVPSSKSRSLEHSATTSSAKVICTPKAASLPGGSRCSEEVPLLYTSNPDGSASIPEKISWPSGNSRMPDNQFASPFPQHLDRSRSASSVFLSEPIYKNKQSNLHHVSQLNIAKEFEPHHVNRVRPFQEHEGEGSKVSFSENNVHSKLHDDVKLAKSNEIVTLEVPVTNDVDRVTLTTPPTLNTNQTSAKPPSAESPKRNGTEIGTVVSRVWENVKKMMGFSPDCLNGGHKNLRGDCVCQKYYEGDRCEKITCANNGTPAKSSPGSLSIYDDICKCPYPEFIYGKHCEMLRCHNGGRDLGNGHCACVDGWYTGQFCQYYTSSWLAAIGLPLLGIAIIIICCVVCRLDLCPRRSSRSRTRRRHHQQTRGATPRSGQSRQNLRTGQFSNDQMRRDQMAHEQALVIQENLLNEGMIGHLDGRQYVVRLEQVPTYNPQLWGFTGANEAESTFKPVEPPPSYEHAVRFSSRLMPPDYTPLDCSNVESQEPQIQNTERISAHNRRPPDSSSQLPR